MTFSGFWRTTLQKQWKFNGSKRIRTVSQECPICFLDNQLNDVKKIKNLLTFWRTKLVEENQFDFDCRIIVNSADNNVDSELFDSNVRNRLLQIYGLEKICRKGSPHTEKQNLETAPPESPLKESIRLSSLLMLSGKFKVD